jgi:hypothetical protein
MKTNVRFELKRSSFHHLDCERSGRLDMAGNEFSFSIFHACQHKTILLTEHLVKYAQPSCTSVVFGHGSPRYIELHKDLMFQFLDILGHSRLPHPRSLNPTRGRAESTHTLCSPRAADTGSFEQIVYVSGEPTKVGRAVPRRREIVCASNQVKGAAHG